MADTRDSATEKTDNKNGRRSSFARALHVPNIARRVKQFEQAVQSDQTHTPTANRPKEATLDYPEKHLNPKLSEPSVAVRETFHEDADVGGAEIPDIPLRRSSNTINTDFTESSLGTWERMLQNGQHPNPLNSNSFQPAADMRYDAERNAMDDRSLYPVTERSWESSLPSVSETSPEPSLKHQPLSPPNIPAFPRPRRDTSVSAERCGELPASPVSLRPVSPFDRETAPSRLAESHSTSRTTATSIETDDQSVAALPPLQVIGVDNLDGLHPIGRDDVDPESFDLVIPAANTAMYSLEHRSELLFSVEHMRIIVLDPILLHRFSTFLSTYRPQSVPLLNYLLEALKAIRALEYVNGIISRRLRPDGVELQNHPSDFAAKPLPELTVNESLKQKTAAAFEALAKDDLPAYITHVWTDIVELSMRRKTMGMMPQNLQYLSEGLAEVFCVTDPSRKDNPIVFASEEFHRTTQYGPSYVMGRNCRFLQGPRTNPFSIQRIREKLAQGKEHYETFLNYRRDGLPFMNLLMCTPLLDSKGQVRYFLGAQIDVSGLAKDCSGLESLRKLVDQDEEEQRRTQHTSNSNSDTLTRRDSGADLEEPSPTAVGTATTSSSAKDPTRSLDHNNDFRLLAEMLSRTELETVRRFGGRMHRSQQEQGQHLEAIGAWHKPRMVLHDHSSPPSSPPQGPSLRRGYEVSDANGNININVNAPNLGSQPSLASMNAIGKPPAIFENYLVVRPYPSLRILFASPTLRVPGMLQSHFMSRIGGSRRIHEQLEHAFAEGHCVTATVKWISAGNGLRNVASTGTIPDSASGASGSTGSTGTVLGGNGHESIGQEGRRRWIHCTPLLGANGHVGVWVVVIVDDDGDMAETRRQRREISRQAAPPVAPPADRGAGGPKSPMSFEKMSHADFSISNRVSEGEFIRKHANSMYEDTKAGQNPRMDGGEREWEKSWEILRAEKVEEIQRSEMRVKNEESQRSEMRTKSPGIIGFGATKPPVAGGPDTNRSHGRSGADTNIAAGNGDGTHPRNSKKPTNMTGPIERAMGSISSVRNNFLSKSPVGTLRQEEVKKQDKKQDQQNKRPASEPAANTVPRKTGVID
ncbi:hypothetical protein N0V93_006627 [Gnomoniopsis smithogilvyi]|uniref:PAC domain-containing protein n=1 Tax=Gnomoniopsis smithogilvyi TaxID=1191159 RepID=A0A9W9CUW5_9PEZI|nr:hypothetical protein N0V93_006627 [Gnomoniopsis smithogilvyi]